MVGLNKTIQQNNKQVLKNIYLSFFYGAKIGIIGLNGSGKSTLLKIIAGLDKSYQGRSGVFTGYSVGYLAPGTLHGSYENRKRNCDGRRTTHCGRTSLKYEELTRNSVCRSITRMPTRWISFLSVRENFRISSMQLMPESRQ